MPTREFELGVVLAEREFDVHESGKPDSKLTFRLGTPVLDELSPRTTWFCPYQILGQGKSRVRAMFGIDAFQALVLTLHTLPFELDSIARENGVSISWAGGEVMELFDSCRTVVDLERGEFGGTR